MCFAFGWISDSPVEAHVAGVLQRAVLFDARQVLLRVPLFGMGRRVASTFQMAVLQLHYQVRIGYVVCLSEGCELRVCDSRHVKASEFIPPSDSERHWYQGLFDVEFAIPAAC